MSGDGRTRVLGLVEGDPSSALSGVGRYVLEALGRHLELAGTIDFAPGGAERALLAAATFRPSRPVWRARFHTSRLAHRVLSRNLRRRVERFGGEWDVALQIHGWVGGQPRPYALFVDQTRLMADRGWPDWMPLTPRERDEVIALELEMYTGAAHIFTMGEPGRDSLTGDYTIPADRITVVGGGLRFGELPPPRELPAAPAILFVGRDFERKGGEVLLEAFARVRAERPDAELHLVGADRRVEAPGVVDHGLVSSPDRLAELYAQARAFVLPSLYEPYGLVLIEAMSYGVPCVGTEVQSIPEILDRGRAGILVQPGDSERLADALGELLDDDGRAHRLGAAGREWVARSLTWDHVAERMAPVLASLAGRS